MAEVAGAQPTPPITREQVQAEIAELEKENSLWSNNLFHRLPGGWLRDANAKLGKLDIAHEQRMRDQHEQRMKNLSESEKVGYKRDPKHSDMYLNQTPKDFYRIIDETIERLGLSKSQIEKLNHQVIQESGQEFGSRYGEGSEARESAKMRLQEVVKPLYEELRLMGYTRYDLLK